MADEQNVCKDLLEVSQTYPSDILSMIFKKQYEFGKKFCRFSSLTSEEQTHWWRVFLDCTLMELTELKSWTRWKHWKDYSNSKIDKEEIKFELADLLHFVVSLALVIRRSENFVYDHYRKLGVSDLEEILVYETGWVYSHYFKVIASQKNPDLIAEKVTEEIFRLMARDIAHGYEIESETGENERGLVVMDLFRNLFRLFAVWGMTDKDVYDYYTSKNKENYARQERGY